MIFISSFLLAVAFHYEPHQAKFVNIYKHKFRNEMEFNLPIICSKPIAHNLTIRDPIIQF